MKQHTPTTRKLAQLSGYESNSRTHSEQQIQQIVESIKTFGFTNPILIDENNTIIAGHARAQAAGILGLKTVPCVLLNDLNQHEKAALVIADNKLALNAGWDFDALKSEMDFLQEAGFDLSITGFDDIELDKIMNPDDGNIDFDNGIGGVVIQYNIIFDTEAQQSAWFAMVKDMKSQFSDAETLGEAIQRYAESKGLI